MRRSIRLLSFCYPTYGKANILHTNARGDRIVLAPDDFLRQLVSAGWNVDVVGLTSRVELPLYRSQLHIKQPSDVRLHDYDLYWHMFRDPTQPEVLDWFLAAKLDYGQKLVINRAERLARHQKGDYLPVLYSHGIGPQPGRPIQPGPWLVSKSEFVTRDLTSIISYAYNNNRGDYPSRLNERIVTEYIDNAENGRRSIVRFGYAFGQGFTGFRYFKDESVYTFKTGEADSYEPFSVPTQIRPLITSAMRQIGVDVCHIEAIPRDNKLYIIDINPYPTASGKTLSLITEDLVNIIVSHFSSQFSHPPSQILPFE